MLVGKNYTKHVKTGTCCSKPIKMKGKDGRKKSILNVVSGSLKFSNV